MIKGNIVSRENNRGSVVGSHNLSSILKGRECSP